jgi:hypothetical protein
MGAPLYLRLALAGILGGLLLIFTPNMLWQGVVAIAVGLVSLFLAFRGFGRLGRWQPSTARGPDFTQDDPEVAGLEPTTTTRLSERIREARERQRREPE